MTGVDCPAVPVECHAAGPLPDPRCTPGVVNPDVGQSTIDRTICVPGWTRTIRPPQSFTAPLKLELMAAYGLGTDTRLFQLDHLIPLELGGATADARNLWPEANQPRPGSGEKDGFENFLHARVCAGAMSLDEARREMASDWAAYWMAAGSPPDPYVAGP